MRASVNMVKEISPNSVKIVATGTVSTRPKFSYRQEITLMGRDCPDFAFKHVVPEIYAWDHAPAEEKTQEIHVITEISRQFRGFPERIDLYIKQWTKNGHVWREFSGTASGTQEIWYKENWDHGVLQKDMWIEWNRGEAREEIHTTEADGLRERYFFRKAKEIIGPPGFFWYRSAEGTLSDHYLARLWRFALNPELFAVENKIGVTSQDFGYQKWPSDLWLKIAYEREGGTYWQAKERLEERDGKTLITSEIYVEKKKLSI